MKALSMDLRQRIIDAVEAGEENMKQIASRFAVSYEVVKKLKYQYRDLGTIEPQTHTCGRKRSLSQRQQRRLGEIVHRNPSLTLLQMRDRLRVDCSETTIWHELRRQGITYKKNSSGRASSSVPMLRSGATLGNVSNHVWISAT